MNHALLWRFLTSDKMVEKKKSQKKKKAPKKEKIAKNTVPPNEEPIQNKNDVPDICGAECGSCSGLCSGVNSDGPLPYFDSSSGASDSSSSKSQKSESSTSENKDRTINMLKIGALIILLVIVAFIAYNFFIGVGPGFNPGPEVDIETFRNNLQNANDIFIIMDVRGVDSTDQTYQNILQCGVDFASSSAIGNKNIVPMSLNVDGCIAPDGIHPESYCFSQLDAGALFIYVKESPKTTFHANGMIVGVGSSYTLGTCGIHQV